MSDYEYDTTGDYDAPGAKAGNANGPKAFAKAGSLVFNEVGIHWFV